MSIISIAPRDPMRWVRCRMLRRSPEARNATLAGALRRWSSLFSSGYGSADQGPFWRTVPMSGTVYAGSGSSRSSPWILPGNARIVGPASQGWRCGGLCTTKPLRQKRGKRRNFQTEGSSFPTRMRSVCTPPHIARAVSFLMTVQIAPARHSIASADAPGGAGRVARPAFPPVWRVIRRGACPHELASVTPAGTSMAPATRIKPWRAARFGPQFHHAGSHAR